MPLARQLMLVGYLNMPKMSSRAVLHVKELYFSDCKKE
jgi:hypothetical protein